MGYLLGQFVAQFLLAGVMSARGDLADAADGLRECVQLSHTIGYRAGVVCSLVLTADLARRRGDVRPAPTLLGAARVLGDQVDVEAEATGNWEARVVWRWYRDARGTLVEPTLAAARAQLGDTEFEAAYAAGQQMTLDQAVEYVLAGG
jgi:hypothetical protein